MKTALGALLALGVCLPLGCGKKAPEQQSDQSPPTPPVQKPEPIEATLTLGMQAAKKAYDEGRYADAVRVYTAELATEEAKSAPATYNVWINGYKNAKMFYDIDKSIEKKKLLGLMKNATVIRK